MVGLFKRIVSGILAAFVMVSILAVDLQIQPAKATTPLQTLNLLGAVVDADHPIGSTSTTTDVSIDNGVTWRPAILGRLHPWASTSGTNSWLNCQSITADTLGSCSATLPVRALFRYRFQVGSDFTNATLAGSISVDNSASVYINGTTLANRILGPINGGTVAQINGGSPLSIQSNLVAGWNTLLVELDDQGGLSGINYNLTLSLNSASPIGLALPGSIVNFDAQGGSVTPASRTVAPAAALSTISFPTPTRSGYTFNGWFTEQDGGVEVDAAYAATQVPTSDLTVYARWTANPVAEPELAATGFPSIEYSSAGVALLIAGFMLLSILRRKTKAEGR